MYKKAPLILWVSTVIIMLLLTNHWSNNIDKLNARLAINKEEIEKLKIEIKKDITEIKANNEAQEKRLIELESQPK